jgi:chromosome segregation ATPase
LKELAALRRETAKLKRRLPREDEKAAALVETIEALERKISHLRRAKKREITRGERIERAVLKLVSSLPRAEAVLEPVDERESDRFREEMRARINRFEQRLAASRTENEEIREEIADCQYERCSPVRIVPTLSVRADEMGEVERDLTDFAYRIELEKKRWVSNLHDSSVKLIGQSWLRQIEQIRRRLSI